MPRPVAIDPALRKPGTMPAMCLVALAWKTHPRWQLVMAGNRDEFHARPTAALAAWPAPDTGLLAGRDLRSGGTWAGVGPGGRMAVVTNVRDPLAPPDRPLPRRPGGRLPACRRHGRHASPTSWPPAPPTFAPFNLLLADRDSCQFLGNHPLGRAGAGARRPRHVQRAAGCAVAQDRALERRPAGLDRQRQRRPGARCGRRWPMKPGPTTAPCPTPASAWNASAG